MQFKTSNKEKMSLIFLSINEKKSVKLFKMNQNKSTHTPKKRYCNDKQFRKVFTNNPTMLNLNKGIRLRIKARRIFHKR